MLRFTGLVALTIAAAPAAARDYSALYTFGDSLVDSGNIQAFALGAGLDDPAPAALGYHEGRFSNGYNAADYLSIGLFGHPTTGALLGGTDYAFGGALAGTNADAVPDLAAQTGYFAAATHGQADTNALYFINAGGNDAFSVAFGVPGTPDAGASAAAIAGTVQTLVGLGARHFLVANVVNVGATPYLAAYGLGAEGDAAARAIDRALSDAIAALTLPGDADVKLFNTYSLAARLRADPAQFGLAGLNGTQPCLRAGASPACVGYQYFDDVHPTDPVYALFGRGLLATVPEPALMALFGVAVGALTVRRGRNRVNPAIAAAAREG